MTSLAGAAVALVILVDLATGQGPPIYTNYLQAQNYRNGAVPPRPAVLPSSLYPQRVEYQADNKELEKAIELGKAGGESPKGPQSKKFDKELGLEAKKHEKELEKSKEKDYGKQEDYESTAAPGMLSSLSSSMSNAWNRFSGLGRSTRSLGSANKAEGAKPDAKDQERVGTKYDTGNGNGSNPYVPASSSRGIDSYEYLQQRQNGYIYFKVPKHLICNY